MIETSSTEAPIPSPLIDLTAKYGQHGKDWGVLLTVIAPEWEKLFQKISGGKIIHFKKEGVEGDFYDFPLAENDRGFLDFYPAQYLIHDNGGGDKSTNLSFLRKEGVGKGIEVFHKGIFEADMIRKFCNKVGERSQSLFRKLSPGTISMKVWIDDWKSGERVVR